MAGTAHLVAALKYIELGNYTANQLLIPFMIAHSNILNEIFRGKFSHNRDHCSPPPAACPSERNWQAAGGWPGPGPDVGAGWHGGSRLSWGLWAEDSAGSAAKALRQAGRSPPRPCAREGAVAKLREKADNRSRGRLQSLRIPRAVRCPGGSLGLSRWHSSLCVGGWA